MADPEDEKHDHSHAHGEACNHGDPEGEDEDQFVTLVDADGDEVEHYWLGQVELDDETFALLCPVEEMDAESENTNVYVYHYNVDEDGAESFEEVEDDALLARA